MQRIKRILAFFAMGLTMSSPCYGQWAIIYGGSGYDGAYSIQQTADSGYIVAGRTDSFGSGDADFWVFKLDAEGSVDWEKTYGGSLFDEAWSVQQTSDGGYIVAGGTESFGTGYGDLWVLKLHGDGAVDWQRTYGGGGFDKAHSIEQTVDGGYIVAGGTEVFGTGYGDLWVLKLHADGAVDWQKTYGGDDWDEAWSVQQTSDAGYIVAGGTYSFGEGADDLWVLKLNVDGAVDWQNTYGGGSHDSGRSVQETSGGGYVLAGYTHSFGTGYGDLWVLKLHADGAVEWQKTYGGSDWDGAYAVQQTSDSGYIVAGRTESFGTGYGDLWVLKLHADGAVEWQKTYGGSDWDGAYAVQQTSDSGYIVAGFGSDTCVLKLDANGEIPNCGPMGTSEAIVSDTSDTVNVTSVIPQDSSVIPAVTTISPQDTLAHALVVCPSPSPVCQCNLNPDATAIPRGGTLGFDITVSNNTDEVRVFGFATYVTKPNGGKYPPSGYLIGPVRVSLNPYGSRSAHRSHPIPGNVPLGTYTYYGIVGTPGAGLYHQCQFDFEVVP